MKVIAGVGAEQRCKLHLHMDCSQLSLPGSLFLLYKTTLQKNTQKYTEVQEQSECRTQRHKLSVTLGQCLDPGANYNLSGDKSRAQRCGLGLMRRGHLGFYENVLVSSSPVPRKGADQLKPKSVQL